MAVELPSGDVIDFIKRDTLPGLPYELPPLPFTAEDLALPPGVELGLTELEQIPELLELAATATPFHRPMFWPYILGETDATSIEDYLARYQEGGDPSGTKRLYAGLVSLEPNRGISGSMNQFRPEVEDNTFSLSALGGLVAHVQWRAARILPRALVHDIEWRGMQIFVVWRSTSSKS